MAGQETIPEVTEQVEAVRISIEDLGKMSEEICRLRKQVDALQTRGSSLMVERQEARAILRDVGNGACVLGLNGYSERVESHLKKYPT